MIKAVIFDFDGVILESVDVKTRAFAALFSDHPEHQQAIVDFHLKNGGMSRFDKFRIIYRDILSEPLSDSHFNYLCRRFQELVLEEVIRCKFVTGAREFLDINKDNYLFFIVSATPHDEIVQIVERRGLSRYFGAVYGAPLPKGEAISKIISDFNLENQETVFIGDAMNDYEASLKADVKFIVRDSGSCGEWCSGLPVMKDLSELSSYLN